MLQRTFNRVRIHAQRGTIVATFDRMKDAMRLARVREQYDVRIHNHRAFAGCPNKYATTRDHKGRHLTHFFAGMRAAGSAATHVEGSQGRCLKAFPSNHRLHLRTFLKAQTERESDTGAAMVVNSSDLIPGLAASGPDPAIGDGAKVFAPLVGDWRIRTSHMPLDKPPAEYEGFWSFRWGLGGRAIYDTIGYRAPGLPDDSPYRLGITVRFYDLELRTWRQVWVGAWSGFIIEFAVRQEAQRIIIEGHHSTLKRYRWSFEEITPVSLHWEGRTSYDGGATWRLEQTIDGTR